MWQKDRSADAAGRLDNLKELIRSMDEFENLAGFLEHISLVMDRDQGENLDAVSIMTLHSAKGLEFDTVFLPGWEEGVFPNQRALDDQGRAGLEEERRLAHVGLTRARRRAKIYFASNRRMHGLWNSNIPSRFLDELPEAHVAVMEAKGGYGMGGSYGNTGASRFDEMTHFGSGYTTPGWQRAQARRAKSARSSNYGEHGFGDADAGSGLRRGAPRRRCGRRSERLDATSGQAGRAAAPHRPLPPRGGGSGRGGPGGIGARPPPSPATAAAARSPSRANWSPNRPAPSPTSRSATASFI